MSTISIVNIMYFFCIAFFFVLLVFIGYIFYAGMNLSNEYRSKSIAVLDASLESCWQAICRPELLFQGLRDFRIEETTDGEGLKGIRIVIPGGPDTGDVDAGSVFVRSEIPFQSLQRIHIERGITHTHTVYLRLHQNGCQIIHEVHGLYGSGFIPMLIKVLMTKFHSKSKLENGAQHYLQTIANELQVGLKFIETTVSAFDKHAT